jgi:hypothetical protein
VLFASNGQWRGAWILDPAIEDQIDAVTGDGRIRHKRGPAELADAKVSYGLDTGP